MQEFYMLPGDWALAALALTLAVTGLFRGFSGSLAFIAASGGAAAAGMFGWNFLMRYDMQTWVRGAIALTFALLIFGAIRTVVHKVTKGLLAQPADAIFGFFAGLLLSAALIVVWAKIGLGIEYSNIAREVALYVG